MLSRRQVLATASAISVLKMGGAMAAGDVIFKRGYVDCRFGQMHFHMAQPKDPSAVTQNPIGCLHPSPASGRYYLSLLENLGRDRVAIAFDTPGYGESDRPPAPPDMDGYAGAYADALTAVDLGPMDLLGYHTGCSIAVHVSLMRPELVRKLCLVAVPYYDSPERQAQLVENLNRAPFREDGKRIFEQWENSVTKRVDGVSLDQAVEVFMERLRAGDKEWWAYQAVFSYPAQDRYAQITHPTALLNPHGVLYDETLAAAQVVPGAELIDLPQLSHGVFHLGSDVIATAARGFLDRG